MGAGSEVSPLCHEEATESSSRPPAWPSYPPGRGRPSVDQLRAPMTRSPEDHTSWLTGPQGSVQGSAWEKALPLYGENGVSTGSKLSPRRHKSRSHPSLPRQDASQPQFPPLPNESCHP